MQTLAYGGNPALWIAIAVVVLVLFGGAKIPEMMKGLGSGMREFKKGLNEDEDDELRKEREREERIRAEVRARMAEEDKRGGASREEEDKRSRESRSRAEEELKR